MFKINENYLYLNDSYLFSKIANKVEQFKFTNPGADLIRLGIGDVTLPLPSSVIKAIHTSAEEMGSRETFKGYGPEQGYSFLRDKIVEIDYLRRGVEISPDEIFISDGSKSDTGNISDSSFASC